MLKGTIELIKRNRKVVTRAIIAGTVFIGLGILEYITRPKDDEFNYEELECSDEEQIEEYEEVEEETQEEIV